MISDGTISALDRPIEQAFSVLRLFSRFASSGDFSLMNHFRLGSIIITVGMNIEHNLIPVRVGSGANAVGCLYDQLGTGGQNPDGSARNDGLYFRQGSGAFVVGPDANA